VQEFVAGQRWISNAELSLGLGTVVAVDFRTINMVFLASGETRAYAKQTAPLNRVVFSPGDSVLSHEGWNLTVTSVQENNGLLTYYGHRDDGTDARLEEGELDNFIQLSRPTDRLFTEQIDKDKWFELRYRTHDQLNRLSNSAIRGLSGGRTSLIPHQLYIAHEVANRYAPRVLLADEVGLGKTIEAGMILHQQLITERAKRILIVVPETLLHQWLVEMLRRFNLFFSIFDQERCLAAEESTQQENPFQTEQLVLCTLDFLVQNPHRFQQALAGEWDVLVVDEAHHLQWSPQEPSIEYSCIEQLASVISGVLLLTATPEQLGKQSHFARLRLLDPDRFPDFDSFIEEEKSYAPVAHVVDELLNGKVLDSSSIDILKSTISEGDNLALLDVLQDDSSEQHDITHARNKLVEHLLDRHGTGRVLFRNTRAAIKGFPSRQLRAYPLPVPDAYAECLADLQATGLTDLQQLLSPELIFQAKQQQQGLSWFDFDPRVSWLQDILKQLKNHKVLVITANVVSALDLVDSLRTGSGIHAAVFHEHLSIVERDRAAAFFADEAYGSQVLVCSEIGSEGRNFQFAHHLILFDLPLNPDLLEQRIGRLDRIGQTETIQIHVPYLQNSAQEIMFQWYHHGLNAFEQTCPTGHNVFTQVEDTLVEALHQIDDGIDDLPALIATTQNLNQRLLVELQQGRDQLLEYNSCRPLAAESIRTMALQDDKDSSILGYLEDSFDCFGIDFEDHSEHCYIARPGEHMQDGNFPGLHDEGMTLTCDRDTALANEDIQFITWDHPLVTAGIDMIVSSELGNTAVTAIKIPSIKQGTLLLECLFMLDSGSDKALGHNRTVPAAMIRTLVDQQGQDFSTKLQADLMTTAREIVQHETAVKIVQGFADTLKQMITVSESLAQSHTPARLIETYQPALDRLETEANRLLALQQVNPNVRDEEIEFFQSQYETLLHLKETAKLRLDAIRVIVAI